MTPQQPAQASYRDGVTISQSVPMHRGTLWRRICLQSATRLMSAMGGKRILVWRGNSRQCWQMRSLLTAAVLALCGCASFNNSEPPLVVSVRARDDECRVAFARPSNVQPPKFMTVHQQQLLAVARSETTKRAVVVFDQTAPYKCTGAAILTLQQAGKIVDVVTWDAR